MYKTLVAAACLCFGTAGQLLAAPDPADSVSPAADILRVQVLLDRLGFSPGVIDGRRGLSLTKAVRGFQEARGVPVTGEVDPATAKLLDAYGDVPPVVEVTLGREDFAGPFVGAIPRSEMAQAKLPAMGYATPLEALAERYHTTSAVLVRLNAPGQKVAEGARVKVPNVAPAARDYPAELKPEWRATLASLSVSSQQPRAARIVVDKSDGVLRVYDEGDKLVAQFPATMGSQHDPLPLGRWKVLGRSYLPSFHYNPKLFWDAGAKDRKAVIKPGPNGPVGVVWMDLSKAHYGIHGTPNPEKIGRTESHGCIRLTNWDAARLSLMVRPNTPALFQP